MQLVIGIPYNPNSFLKKIIPSPSPIQIFEVPEDRNPREILEMAVVPQRVEKCSIQISSRAIAYRVDQKGCTIISQLTEKVLTPKERRNISKLRTSIFNEKSLIEV